TQNDFMQEWLPWRDKYMSIIFEIEAQEKQGSLCEKCHKAEGVIQCKSCVGLHAWCKSCVFNVH
ncbi:hypothetical protein PAXRUDRAFT_181092, partial [Paxillus rubicundulus Ve08.2h10]